MPILILNQPFVFTGLGTFTYTVTAAGTYYVSMQSTEVPPSGITITVTQNGGSAIFTSPVLTPTQGAFQAKYSFPCAVSDAIAVTIASSSAIDSVLNNVKTTVAFGQGQ